MSYETVNVHTGFYNAIVTYWSLLLMQTAAEFIPLQMELVVFCVESLYLQERICLK